MNKISVLAVLFAIACGSGDESSVSGAQSGAAGPDQVLGDDFKSPPEGSVDPADGPDPAVCVGATVAESAQADAPYGNAVDGEMSLDWALTDFQPQSCGYNQTYGMDGFKGRVTVLALLASW
ncbi:MAG: hypothetical protein ACI9OJ_003363 [Myxococcota bacterium]|jgi:hypothetical protein